jgi:F0F1-type ATP synthase assembly protein I
MFPDPKESKELGRYLALGQVGLEMVVPIILGLAADRYFGSGPWGLVVGAALGLSGGLVHLVHQANKMNADNNPTDHKRGPR